MRTLDLRLLSLLALVAQLPACGGAMASRAHTRYEVARGVLPAPDEVRVDELLAAYPESLPNPAPNALGVTIEGARAAFAADETGEPLVVVQTAIRGRNPDVRPPMALMLVVDRSGSMAEADKMTFVREALHTLVGQLDPNDTLGLVAFDNYAEVLLPLTTVGEGTRIHAGIDQLQPRGATNLSAGLELGYDSVAHAPQSYLRRVVLLTDAMANVGETDLHRIASQAEAGDERGTRLSCIGVGLAYRDDVMVEMARRGRGNHYFLDSGDEIRRVFEQEVHGLLEDVADRAVLTFQPVPGVEVVRVEGAPARPVAGGWQVDLQRVGAMQHRVVLWTLRGVAQDDRTPTVGRLTLDWVDMRTREAARSTSTDPVFLVADASEGTVARNAAVAWMARDLRAVSELAHQGQHALAQARLDRIRAVMSAVHAARPTDGELARDRRTLEDWASTLARYTGTAVQPVRARISVRYE